ncbi:MAG: GNAT family N-acetyltransferase [Firmicutes bacterium]|nr:GNAT family N-acetyltransferase [Bacillota bacterium]
MYNTTIHRISGKNVDQLIPGIVNVFRDDEVVPWHKYDSCLAWVTKRIERGFYITVACDDDTITGYSEWIEMYDKGEKILYLGIMQVDCDLRSRGIGKMMLDNGEEYAKSVGASRLRTMPEDERSHNFYRKNRYVDTDTIYTYVCSTVAGPVTEQCVTPVAVTLDIANSHEFVFGLWQSSGRHMYEVANHNPEPNEFIVKTITIPEGYLQFMYKKGKVKATALYWSNEEVTPETVSAILAYGHAAGLEEIEFVFKTRYIDLFAAYNSTGESIEIEKSIDKVNGTSV